MSVLLFFGLGLVATAAIVYPLLPGPRARQAAIAASASPVSEAEIDRAVRALVEARRAGEPRCPACDRPCQPGDRFCVGCGGTLPQVARTEPRCPSCGAAYREGDRFCARCGELRPEEERR